MRFKQLLSKPHPSLWMIIGHSECLQNSKPSVPTWCCGCRQTQGSLSRDLVTPGAVPVAELPLPASVGLWGPWAALQVCGGPAVQVWHILVLQRASSPQPWAGGYSSGWSGTGKVHDEMQAGEKCFSWRSQKQEKHLWEAGASGTPTFANCSWVSWR